MDLSAESSVMTDVSPISSAPLGRTNSGATAPGRGASGSAATTIRRAPDRVEVSAVATYLSKLKLLPPIRQELVDSVRAQLDAGTYETVEKIDAAVEQLAADLPG